jgi:glyoxylase I family protein
MAKIKHIAITTADPDATARFYTDVMGLKQVGRVDHPAVYGHYLSDGDINLAVLRFRSEAAAGPERGTGFFGIHHFGFQVDSVEEIAERLAAAGVERRDDINEALGVGKGHERYANVEVKYSGPDGVIVDVSESGWVGTPTFRPA